MHELGHNLYLNHAGSFQPVAGGGSQFVAYKDDSGAMGHCCSTRCFNAPHSHQLGWSTAIDTLNKDNFAAGAPSPQTKTCFCWYSRSTFRWYSCMYGCSKQTGFAEEAATHVCWLLQQRSAFPQSI
eukprot:GHRQ01032545.1.p3 GENE.GHRQ01032545.1~~GHRQ01032545.1.p3  ORF type:complete len:126 (+),score=39.24 GHRQ01032545.1:369-746(+)